MSVWNDVRLAVRMLLRDRSFTLTASAALALGIAANSLVFTLVNGVLLRELPFHEPDRLMAIESRVAGNSNVSYLDLRDLQASMRTFSGVAGVDQRSMNIADQAGAAERLTGAYVSANTLGLLGRQPVLGGTSETRTTGPARNRSRCSAICSGSGDTAATPASLAGRFGSTAFRRP